MEFPLISLRDFESDFPNLAKQIFKASQEWGFFIVTDHGIHGAERMFEMSREFFDLPEAIKTQKIMNKDPVVYDGHKATTFAASEGMSFGLPTGQLFKSNNLHSWWDLHRLTEIEAFKAQCNDLTFKVLSCFAWHMGLPKDFFTTSHQDGLPRNTLKFIKYPKLAIKPDDAVPRLTEHTDWGSITLLFTDSPGLEVLDPQDQWHEVPQLPGGIVINIGDALSLWTGQQLKSTMHRISWEKVPVDQDRYSMPYFVHPNFTTNLRSLRAPESMEAKEITYKDYYNFRMKLTWGSLQSDDGAGALEDVEKGLLSYINNLGVTRTLESHALTRTEEVQ